MAFNFSKLQGGDSIETVVHPRELFAALPAKKSRYQYPRDVQTEVWNQWFQRRTQKDLIVRMNTGSGKTVVALLILKCSLNEKHGPAVYIAPDQYLAKQVMKEAQDLGLEVTSDPDSLRFLKGKAILVTTIRTLVNGQSVFGVGGMKIEVGSLIIDDSHACLETTEGQFTMVLDGLAHDEVLNIFRDDLRRQAEATLLEVESHLRGMQMVVPFWSWADKQSQLLALLHKIDAAKSQNGKNDDYTSRTREALRFNLPLLRDTLRFCRCVIGEGIVEISPRVIPIDVIPSFVNVKRRIVISATLSDDSILVSHFDLDPETIKTAITPTTANDIGDRLILIPQVLNPEFTDEALKQYLVQLSLKHNVVVIVPSNRRAGFWEDAAKLVLRAENLEVGVEQLKSGHVGLVILVNKYDGIDLPKNACHVLVIDGLPDVRRSVDKVDEAVLYGTDQILSQKLQRIEQGMGRGVRSNDDFCLVFLVGKTLTNFLFKAKATQKFGSATKAQLSLSDQITDELHGKPMTSITEVCDQFLARDEGWVRASKGALVNLKYEAVTNVSEVALKQRKAFMSARRNDLSSATRALNEASNSTSELKIRGWLKAQLAEYTHFINPSEAQTLLRSAISDNPRVLRPLEGITYHRLPQSVKAQAAQCAEFLKNNFESGNALIIELNSLITLIDFQPDTSNSFEQAIKDAADILGFRGQRPEKEYGQGPDVLWECGDLLYFVIECKNGVTSGGPINKHDCNQLNGSIVWFKTEYDQSCKPVAILIHPVSEFEYAASLDANANVITRETLPLLKEALRKFGVAAAAANWSDHPSIAAILKECGLTPDGFRKFFVSPFRSKKN